MKLYQVTQTLDEDVEREWEFFGSRTEAKKTCNALIRRSFEHWKEVYGIKAMGEMPESDTIEIAEVITAAIPTKAMFILMLNYEGGYFESQRVIEQWNPQDKWHKPQEANDA
jgi:hypothetical protein